MVDHSETKEKILRTLRTRGPSLPVHISSQIDSSILFTSAFLSELLSEKKITMTNLRVGSSPVYFLQGQEPQLEKFSQHLKSKEKEAFLLLKEKRFLKDEIQHPAIRVALREIKDFAIPFQKDNEVFWRFFTVSENEFPLKKTTAPSSITPPQTSKQPPTPAPPKKEEKQLDIFDKPGKKIRKLKSPAKKKSSKKKNEKFFNKVKEFLAQKSIEISGIEGFGTNELILKVREDHKEKLLVAFNKKKVTEEDIIKAHKRASESNIQYIILSLGEPLKKLNNFIDAIKNLDKIEKLE